MAFVKVWPEEGTAETWLRGRMLLTACSSESMYINSARSLSASGASATHCKNPSPKPSSPKSPEPKVRCIFDVHASRSCRRIDEDNQEAFSFCQCGLEGSRAGVACATSKYSWLALGGHGAGDTARNSCTRSVNGIVSPLYAMCLATPVLRAVARSFFGLSLWLGGYSSPHQTSLRGHADMGQLYEPLCCIVQARECVCMHACI